MHILSFMLGARIRLIFWSQIYLKGKIVAPIFLSIGVFLAARIGRFIGKLGLELCPFRYFDLWFDSIDLAEKFMKIISRKCRENKICQDKKHSDNHNLEALWSSN